MKGGNIMKDIITFDSKQKDCIILHGFDSLKKSVMLSYIRQVFLPYQILQVQVRIAIH